ncbi:MAG TPA: hypothetical protein VEG32_09710 [Clostridia bacterium]|nr:hypothetical protein [Clostridia bacterium]
MRYARSFDRFRPELELFLQIANRLDCSRPLDDIHIDESEFP